MTHKTKVPHSLKLKHRYAKTASTFLERLPISQQFKASRDFLLRLTPVWQQWCTGIGKAHRQSFDNCQLTAFEKGVLSISANNASTATLIKHQTDSLLSILHLKGFNEVQSVRVHIHIPSRPVQHNSALDSASSMGRQKPNKSAISALKSAAKSTDDTKLSESLRRLANTLSK